MRPKTTAFLLLVTLLLCLVCAIARAASVAVDYFNGTTFSQVDVTTGANALLGFDGTGQPTKITAGTGISISGGILTATGGGGGSGTVTSISGSGGTTGLTLTGGAITTSGTLTLGGTLALANGGTGSTTASAARTALGLAIGSDVQAYSASTSILGSSIDLTTEITGTLALANGGTGATTAAGARLALLPAVTDQAEEILRVNAAGTDYETTPFYNLSLWMSTLNSVAGSPPDYIVITNGLTGFSALETGSAGLGLLIAADAAALRTSVLPSKTGGAGKYLRVNATATDYELVTVSEPPPPPAEMVTSISGSGGTTGLTLTGGPITDSGTLTLGGTLAIANGGTGATTASAARTALGLGSLATQSGTFSGTHSGSSSGTNTGDQDLSAYLTSGSGVTISGSIIYGIITGRSAGPVQNDDGQILFTGGLNFAPFTGGTGGQLQMQGADATEGVASGGNGGSLIMYGTEGQNAGSITTIAGGSLTMGTADLAGGNVAGTILTTAGNGSSLTNLSASSITTGTLALSLGGTGAALSDPNADRIGFWDDSAGIFTWLTVGSGLTITGTTITASGGGTGTVTSVSGSGGTTGLTLTGGPITDSGTLTLGGTLALANGGTGATTASAARTALGLAIGTDVQAYSASTSLLGSSIDLSTEITGTLALANGGTGATTASAARTALGLAIGTDVQAYSSNLADLADGSLTGTLVAAATTSARGSAELATDGETAASVVVQGNDSRLVNAGKVEIGIALSDETSDNTASTTVPKVSFRMPFAMNVSSLRCSLTKAATGAVLTVDVHEAGTSIMTTNKLTVDASETTSTTAASAHALTDTVLADDSLIELFLDVVGTSADNTGEGIKIWILGTR